MTSGPAHRTGWPEPPSVARTRVDSVRASAPRLTVQASLLDLADDVRLGALTGRVRRTPLAHGAWVDHRPGWVEGSDAVETSWHGATWRFASAAHRDLFVAAPERYAPQYGGYCAWAVSQGYTADGDPESWKIVDGKLYLNYNREIQQRWEADIPGLVTKADANWPKLLGAK